VLDISGTIQADSSTSSLFSESTGYDHSLLMSSVEDMMADPNNKGLLLDLDTPGGTVYEADELYLKIMEYKETTGRPVYAYMHSYAASGGYYIAMAADEIYANRNTLTGSIGVIVSTYDMSELYEKLGIKEVNITSGPNKAMGSSGTPMTDEQLSIYQAYVDEAYNQFVDVIVNGRGLSRDTVLELADGRIYSAAQALDLDLIDGICGYEDYLDSITEDFDPEITFYQPSRETSYFSMLFSKLQTLIPKSESQVLEELADSKESGVLMYYAK
jgi:protease-4